MTVGHKAVPGRCRPGGRRSAYILAPSLLLVAACECWMVECDDFSCSVDSMGITVGETRTLSAPLCHPYDSYKATLTAESLDTTIVTVTVDGYLVTFVGRKEGWTTVTITAMLPDEPNTGYFHYEVTSSAAWQGEVTTCAAKDAGEYTEVHMSAWLMATIGLRDVTVHLGIGGASLGTHQFEYLAPGDRVSFNTDVAVTGMLTDHECTLDATYTVVRD